MIGDSLFLGLVGFSKTRTYTSDSGNLSILIQPQPFQLSPVDSTHTQRFRIGFYKYLSSYVTKG